MADDRITIRPLASRDSFDALTTLLHRAYAPLAAQGMNFSAATQDAETTRRRAAEGHCLVAELDGAVVGTVTVSGPYGADEAPWTATVPWFRDRDTAHFHQFAVDPALQRQGLGRRLVQACEQWAHEHGFKRMALDTAEPARALRALYRRLGYAEVGQVQWDGKHYRSVIMLKSLDHDGTARPLREQLQTMARYHLWATRRLLAATDALPEADYRRDAGLFFRSVHGTLNHLLVAEQMLWLRRFAEGVSPVVALDTEAEPDRARLGERLLEGALAWPALLEVWPDERLLGELRYRRMSGEELVLPFAATLAHVFNHATHHRGQVTAALTALGHRSPELDLVYMLQEERATA
jgi:uncharacterized damage-inducible protein DinB/ribosomal protein S18 acetylase RimI-like enzyme